MTYIDIHSHQKRQTNNVLTVYNVSIGRDNNEIGNEMDYPLVSTGIHPWHLEQIDAKNTAILLKKVAWERVSLVGECGFDKQIDVGFEIQKNIFLQHVTISEQHQKPLIIHCVGYYNELFVLRKQLAPTQRWLLHGFRGKPQLAQQALRSGFELSFGIKHNAESVMLTPTENLFLETDDSNVPIEQVYQKVAEIKKCKIDILRAGKLLLKEQKLFKSMQ